ncbi:sensor histidine kinase [Phaeacidiphilus oryzae]|uniref:sensor histidine kinase n=1 Tax=Phaeacidiphilus oryzae TaxID=348818 RepID=UPI0007C81769|nr:sensor histidine kinase [Phaeacidiphilus oryzae]
MSADARQDAPQDARQDARRGGGRTGRSIGLLTGLLTGRPWLRRSRWSVRQWFMLAFGSIGAVAVVVGIAGAILLARADAAGQHLVDQVAPARLAAAQLQSALLDQETGVRGYLLTGNRDLLQPYDQGLLIERQSVARLTSALGDEPRVRADLTAIERAAGAWRTQFAEPALNASGRTGASGGNAGRAGGGDAARRIAGFDAGKPQFDRLRALLGTQSRDLDAQRTTGEHRLSVAQHQRDVLFVALLAAFVVIGGGIAVLVQLAVIRPLLTIRKAANRVAGGELRYRIPDHGPSDLRAVAQAVEEMRSRVIAELDAAQEQERRLRAQGEALDAQAVELRRSNADLEQFAYVASHDLQEPLRKVASFCQLLEKRYGDRLDDRARQYIDFAVDGAKRMQNLINDLLTYSRVGRVHGADQTVDSEAAVDRALDNLSAAIERGGAQIERPDELPQVHGDPLLLGMLWQNLIGNAVKFRSPDRPSRVVVRCAPDPEDPGMARFSVADNGIGIPEEFREKVFVIFQRLNARDEYEGTGIGLSLCKKIVEYCGGRIWVERSEDPGTNISFTLPLAQEVPAQRTAAADPPSAAAGAPAPGGPATEGATTDGPATDGPTTDGPTTDGPTTDGPATEGPDGPEAEAPTTDGPRAEAPPTEEAHAAEHS